MKKFLSLLAVAVLMFATASCSSCSKEQKTTSMVEKTISSDIAYMDAHHSDYVWYESQIVLSEYLDFESTPEVVTVDNVFQYLRDGQPQVVIFKHYANSRCDTVRYDDMWVEDCAITPSDIKLTFNDAYDRLMAANYPKPHSRKCALRKPMGPSRCNAQYVFGNISEAYFVDALTGNVVNSDPSFNQLE